MVNLTVNDCGKVDELELWETYDVNVILTLTESIMPTVVARSQKEADEIVEQWLCDKDLNAELMECTPEVEVLDVIFDKRDVRGKDRIWRHVNLKTQPFVQYDEEQCEYERSDNP
jgi:hypothetical protein